MMIRKADLVIYGIVAVLFCTYIISFSKGCTTQEKREALQSALINPRYKEQVYRIEFYDDKENTVLTKKDGLWLVSDAGFEEAFLPADGKKIENFLADFTKIIKMYKISDKISKNSSFGLLEDNSFHIRYYYDGGFNELIFGNQDFSLDSRYMMSSKNTTVYEINDTIRKYLSGSVQFWAEGSLVSSQVLGGASATDLQRVIVTDFEKNDARPAGLENSVGLLDLRHGGLPSRTEYDFVSTLNPSLKITLEFGSKKSCELEFFPLEGLENQNGIIVKSSYFSDDGIQERTGDFYAKISLWTYNRIKEITL